MRNDHPWNKAKEINIQTAPVIEAGFDIGFDNAIPDETKNELRRFVKWAEENFNFPITLWVDFEYKHYLIDREGKRVGFLFYWADFSSYPRFDNKDDIPMIRLPVRTEHSTMEEILTSFIKAISYYFAWIGNTISDSYKPNADDVEEVLQAYLKKKQS